ncbi:uncharacterized protein LOC121404754 isoform X1 [Drosophila obscura]|uniref:uncharacterized protein LOC121404754 isoform X1 n=1 Tax=Drosophila obscura TaxID=7282 RepID=UPI001BB24F05|nr:uncharacterized protein LOC121404754 isoform X1 [Drosophila obscura]
MPTPAHRNPKKPPASQRSRRRRRLRRRQGPPATAGRTVAMEVIAAAMEAIAAAMDIMPVAQVFTGNRRIIVTRPSTIGHRLAIHQTIGVHQTITGATIIQIDIIMGVRDM